MALRPPQPRRQWFRVIWTCLFTGLTVVCAFVAAAQWTGLDPARDNEAALSAIAVGVMTAAMAVAGVLASTRPRPVPVDWESQEPDTRRERLPAEDSAARAPVLRLVAAESLLTGLLARADAAPSPVVDRAWLASAELAARLRVVATRVEALERAADQLRPLDRVNLDDEVDDLREHLDHGVAEYRGLAAVIVGAVLDTPTRVDLNGVADDLVELMAFLHALAAPTRHD